VLYELPFGRGKLVPVRNGVLDDVVGGWKVSSLFQIHSGLPFTPYVGTENMDGSLAGTWRPNRIGSGELSHPTISEWFDTSAFVQPPWYTFGNSGRNILYGPGYTNVNMALLKDFSLGERVKLQFKAEASNVFNHPNFKLPNSGIGTPTAGMITSAYDPRTMQMGAKLTF
jgi:hypothetical protein